MYKHRRSLRYQCLPMSASCECIWKLRHHPDNFWSQNRVYIEPTYQYTTAAAALQQCKMLQSRVCNTAGRHHSRSAGFPPLLENPGSPGIFFFKFPGPGKSWKLKFKVLESPGKISLKITCY